MTDVLIQIFGLIGIGLAWAILRPAGIDADQVRKVFTNTVYYLFLPALVIDILWTAKLGLDSVKISLSAVSGVLISLVLASMACRACKSNRPVTGAIMLAAAFPNATYMGIPLQESLFGSWARGVVIQYDLFAVFPLALTVGMLIASHYGDEGKKENPFLTMFKVVPLWAAFIGVCLNVYQVAKPVWLGGLLSQLSAAVIPMMLISVGLALLRGVQEWRKLKTVIPVALIQLFVMPAMVWLVAKTTGLQGDVLKITVLEGALPSMALGIVVSDRYGLNTGVYASALTLTTALSIFTLPLWVQWLGGI